MLTDVQTFTAAVKQCQFAHFACREFWLKLLHLFIIDVIATLTRAFGKIEIQFDLECWL